MLISIIGMSGAGKSVIGKSLQAKLAEIYPNRVVVLDGDELRRAVAPDLGHSYEERRESEARRSRLANLLCSQGVHVILAAISNEPEWREWCRENVEDYFEVYLKVPLSVLIKRDSKGLYHGAAEGTVTNVVGVDIEFVPPTRPDLVLENHGQTSIDTLAQIIIDQVCGLSKTSAAA